MDLVNLQRQIIEQVQRNYFTMIMEYLKFITQLLLKDVVERIFESVPEKEYKKDGVFDTTTPDQESLTKFKVLGLIQDLSPQIIESKVLNDLRYFLILIIHLQRR